MDPTANLREQLEIARTVIVNGEHIDADAVTRLAELVLALNRWMSEGGFLPVQWRAE